jgi:hypothetical protein
MKARQSENSKYLWINLQLQVDKKKKIWERILTSMEY